MARPLKDGLDYFPHDTDAANDEKVEALRAIYGNDGYAFYFILLERIYRASNFELDISDAETIQILARKTAVTIEKFNQMLSTALKRGCFDQQTYDERRVLTSNGIKKRASVVVKKREEMRVKYQKDKGIISDAETHQETQPETPQSKVKKSKDLNNNNNNDHDKALDPKLSTSKLSTGEIDTGNTEIFTVFENEFGRPLSPMEIEQIELWYSEHSAAVILEALKRAVLGGKFSFKYIDTILLEWEKNKIRTIQAILEFDAEFEKRKVQARSRDGPKKGQARAPDPIKTKEKEFIRSLYYRG